MVDGVTLVSKVSALNIECSYREPVQTPNTQDMETHKERHVIHKYPVVFFNRICLVFNALKVLNNSTTNTHRSHCEMVRAYKSYSEDASHGPLIYKQTCILSLRTCSALSFSLVLSHLLTPVQEAKLFVLSPLHLATPIPSLTYQHPTSSATGYNKQ
jgi:hypothetical protein